MARAVQAVGHMRGAVFRRGQARGARAAHAPDRHVSAGDLRWRPAPRAAVRIGRARDGRSTAGGARWATRDRAAICRRRAARLAGRAQDRTRRRDSAPRFKTSSSFELAEAIGRLGMAKAFRYRDADFSGMDGTRELFISAVAHQALVDVDEHGTEAAAATALGVMLGRGPAAQRPVALLGDHPLLFLVPGTTRAAPPVPGPPVKSPKPL